MSDTNQSKASNDVQKRIDAARVLQANAEAIHVELIDELAAKRQKLVEQQEQLAKEIKALDGQITDLSHNLSCLRGELWKSGNAQNIQSKRHHVKDEVILAFLMENGTCTTSEVQAYFKFSSATVCRRMNALLAAGKVNMEKRGTTKIWKTVA